MTPTWPVRVLWLLLPACATTLLPSVTSFLTQDVAPVLTKPLPKKALHTLEARDGIAATMPRWMADGRSILCVRFEPDPQGFLHPDLFRWTPETGDLERLTRQADLRDPDPSPLAADPDWAVAVRKRDGASSVVRIDLKSGQETALAGPTLEEVYDRPRIAPDGRRIAYARHIEGMRVGRVRATAAGPRRRSRLGSAASRR